MKNAKATREVAPDVSDYIGPLSERSAYPRDIGIHLSFPGEVETPEEKIRYTLWKEGQQSFINLLLLTGLPTSQLRSAMDHLIQTNTIREQNVRSSSRARQLYNLVK